MPVRGPKGFLHMLILKCQVPLFWGDFCVVFVVCFLLIRGFHIFDEFRIKVRQSALAGVAQWIERWPAN